MKPKIGVVLIAVALLVTGCKKASGPNATATVGTGGGSSPTAAVDYRKFTKQQLINEIETKLSYKGVVLNEAGKNRYTGTVKSPDETTNIPLTVTVEAEQITCEKKVPGMSQTDIITPQGIKVGELKSS